MKKLLIILILSMPLLLNAAKYYIAPTGNDTTGDGTIETPYRSIKFIWSSLNAGDTVYVRGGNYGISTTKALTGKSGSAGNYIKIWAYHSEIPVIKRSADTWTGALKNAFWISGNYLHFKGLEFSGFRQLDETETGLRTAIHLQNSNYCKLELLNIHDCSRGIWIEGDCTGNIVLNCDLHDNRDPYSSEAYSAADGLEITNATSPYYSNLHYNNITYITGCRFWYNSDDGVDGTLAAGYIVMDQCWAWKNGYTALAEGNGDGNGFKLDNSNFSDTTTTFRRTITRCITSHNGATGFNQANGKFNWKVYNCISYHDCDFGMSDWTAIGINTSGTENEITNCIAFDCQEPHGYQANISAASTVTTSSFLVGNNQQNTNYSVTSADFKSVDYSLLATARNTDGSLPSINFLYPVATSEIVDAGTDVGYGNDLGAFQYVAGVVIDPPAPKGTTVKVSGKVIKQNQIIRR